MQKNGGSMKSYMELNENWSMRKSGDTKWRPASIPGSVYSNLLEQGEMKNPYYGENQYEVCEISRNDFEFACYFKVTEDIIAQEKNFLQFDGLDTLVDIYLNGQKLGRADNMHRTWRYDVTGAINTELNELKLYFYSPIRYIEEKQAERPLWGVATTIPGYPYLRKAHFMYGWDWGPQLPDMGIWRKVTLYGVSKALLDNIHIRQEHKSGGVELSIQAEIEAFSEGRFDMDVRILDPEGKVIAICKKRLNGKDCNCEMKINNPKLWWPNGYGEQPLYPVEARLMEGDCCIDSKTVRTGLRTIRVSRDDDQWGQEFCIVVNETKIFAMGADYIPEDQIISRCSPSKTRHLLEQCVKANFNHIRVWGGGYYPEDYFFDICDELGLLVWQDFMFACAMYPGDPEFLENVKQEAVDNVIRLRNHPCIALWCGNNEIDAAWRGWGWKREYTQQQQERIFKAYTDVFHRLLPEVIEKYTDGDDYWPSSPMSGPEIGDHEIRPANRGDNHYWGVWHEKHKFEEYEKNIGRFISEHGFQSFPEFETVRQYTLPEDYDIESEIMSAHQRSGIGNLRIREYMGWYYQVPEDFGQMLYMSQVLQARAMRIAMETHRRHMPYCMGSLVWQLNDCWPVASWSTTDYYHNWKAAQYALREACKPVILAPQVTADSLKLWVVNDLPTPLAGTYTLEIKGFDGKLHQTRQGKYKIKANEAAPIAASSIAGLLQDNSHRETMAVITIRQGKKIVDRQNVYFALPKELLLRQPDIQIQISEEQGKKYLTATTDRLACDVMFYLPGVKAVFTDNYKDLLPGHPFRTEIRTTLSKEEIEQQIRCRWVGK